MQGLSDLSRSELTKDYESARVSDDSTTFNALYTFIISGNRLRDDIAPGGRPVSEVRNAIKSIFVKFSSESRAKDVTELVIKSFMLLYIPYAFLWNASQPRSDVVDQTAVAHLKKEEVWLAMKRYPSFTCESLL